LALVSALVLVQASGQLLVQALVQVLVEVSARALAVLTFCTMAPGMFLGVQHSTAHSHPGCTKH
jgi:hypothetical protein